MRAIPILFILALPALAGCISDADETQPLRHLDVGDIVVPAGASVEPIPDGISLVWSAVPLPLMETITVPSGATMVRLVGTVDEGDAVNVAMANAETGRRRCNNPTSLAYGLSITGEKSCSALTAIDEPGARWTISVAGPADDLPGAPYLGGARVEFLTTAPDGLAGRLDLSQISLPTHEIASHEWMRVASFDGTELHIEVTLPEGEGPWPVIISSSPYNQPTAPGARAPRAMWDYFTHDWAKRGYAVVNADVRGYGESGGCVEVWSKNEQLDQVFLVDWAAAQDWSNGNVGFYGQSYLGTTAIEAAVYAPEALKAIVSIAPVMNAYEDWHFGGVPNGENALSPVAYQVLTGVPADPTAGGPLQFIENSANGLCDATMLAEANDPRATYGPFYEERNFKLKAKDITAAVLYTQGFEDANVKSAMIPGWFNDIKAPKLGVFGHWLHQHPSRMDQEVLFLGWMDQYVKGRAVGFEALPDATILADGEHHRYADVWPPVDSTTVEHWPEFGAGALSDAPASGSASFLLDPAGVIGDPARIVLETTIGEPTPLAGSAELRLVGRLTGAANAYVGAYLYESGPDVDAPSNERLLTWGQFNLAHRNGHDRYDPLTPGDLWEATLPFRPTEHILHAGSTLRLEARGVSSLDNAYPALSSAGAIELVGGSEGTVLRLPTVAMDNYTAVPVTATS